MVATCMRLRIRYHNKSYCQHLTVWTWSLKSIEVLELVDRRSLSLMNLSMFPKPSRSQCQLASLLKHQVGFIATIKLSTIPWASWTLRHQWSATNLPIWICMMNCQSTCSINFIILRHDGTLPLLIQQAHLVHIGKRNRETKETTSTVVIGM